VKIRSNYKMKFTILLAYAMETAGMNNSFFSYDINNNYGKFSLDFYHCLEAGFVYIFK